MLFDWVRYSIRLSPVHYSTKSGTLFDWVRYTFWLSPVHYSTESGTLVLGYGELETLSIEQRIFWYHSEHWWSTSPLKVFTAGLVVWIQFYEFFKFSVKLMNSVVFLFFVILNGTLSIFLFWGPAKFFNRKKLSSKNISRPYS